MVDQTQGLSLSAIIVALIKAGEIVGIHKLDNLIGEALADKVIRRTVDDYLEYDHLLDWVIDRTKRLDELCRRELIKWEIPTGKGDKHRFRITEIGLQACRNAHLPEEFWNSTHRIRRKKGENNG